MGAESAVGTPSDFLPRQSTLGDIVTIFVTFSDELVVDSALAWGGDGTGVHPESNAIHPAN